VNLDLENNQIKSMDKTAKNITARDGKIECVATWNGLMFDQLEEFFTLTTGMNTRL